MSNQQAELSQLVDKIQQFFNHQIENNNELGESSKESLTVAVECISQAYDLERKPASDELMNIFKAHKQQQQQQQQTSSSNNTGQTQTGAAATDPTHLLHNLASSFLSQMTGVGQQAQQQQQQPQQQSRQTTTTASNSSNTTTNPNRQTRVRKSTTEAERIAAESFKNLGNDLMKQDKYQEAVENYTKAIEIDDNNAIYYSNRAAAYSKLGDPQAALRDCQEAIEIDPTYNKAYSRMGLAYASMNELQKAKEAYEKAIELDPTNEAQRNNLRAIEEKLAEARASGGNNNSNPNVPGAGGPNVMNVLGSMMNNPELMSIAMQSLQSPRIQNMFGLGGQAAAAAGGADATSTPNANIQAEGGQQQESESTRSSTTSQEASAPNAETQSNPQQQQQQATPQPGAGINAAELLNLTSRLAGSANIDLVGTGQQLIASLQQNNPDLVNNMRRMMTQAFMQPPQNNQDNDQNPPPGYS